MRHYIRVVRSASLLLIIAACNSASSSQAGSSSGQPALIGAWRSKIAFKSGPLAGMKGLEFLHSYNAGGTMTESSNFDEAANSSPPAYGIWKQTGPRQYETKYIYYTTREPGASEAPYKSDWWPAGHGVLTEVITMSEDGQSYTSTIKLVTYDTTDAVIAAAGGEGTGQATRIVF